MAPLSGASPGGGTSKRLFNDGTDTSDATISLKKVLPYDPLQEQTPMSVTLTGEWKTLEKGRLQIYRLLTDPFTESSHSTKLTEKLVELADQNLVNLKREDTIVCMSGNMGGGKSATLNSLFQVGNIARAADGGKSCTLASNQFMAPKNDQQTPFLAEVFFFPTQERRDLLASYLKDYFRALHHNGDEEGPAEASENVTIRTEVVKAFLALFQDKEECQTKAEVRKFLDTAESEDDPDILTKIFSWSENLIRRARNTKHTVVLTASTAGELLTQLESFATEMDAEDGCALWPLVSLIRFHFDDPLTKLGIIFLDTPGITDHNRTRKLSALKYSRNKSHALIVTEAGRAQSDNSVGLEVKSMNSLGPNRVIIVLPKSDVIGAATIPSGSKRQKDMIKHFNNQVGLLERELEDLEEKIATAEDEDDGASSIRLSVQKRKLDVRLHAAKCTETAHRIKIRSEDSKSEIQDKLREVSISVSAVPIYPISNTAYADHILGYLPKNAPVLSVEETNIPDLRRHISTFTNEARLNEAGHEQNITIPRLITRWRLFTSRTPIERKADMQIHVMAPLKRYASIVRAVFSQFATRLWDVVITPAQNEEKGWLVQVEALCTAWEDEFKAPTLLSLMKKYGHRRGNKRNRAVNMSGDLVQLNSSKMNKLFGSAVHNQLSFEATMTEDILGLFGDMERSLYEDANSSFIDIGPFLAFLANEKPRLLAYIRSSAARVLKGLEVIRRKATFAEEDAYVATAMQPIFEKVCLMKNTPKSKDPDAPKVKAPPGGWPQLRNKTFRQEVGQPNGVWAAVCSGIDQDVQDLLSVERTALIADIGRVLDECLEAFESTCDAKEVSGPDEEKLQTQVTVNVKKVQELLDGDMQRAYNALRRDFH